MFRTIIVFLTCAFFASASFASAQLQCCAEVAVQQAAQQDMVQKAEPCHMEMAAAPSKKQSDTHKTLTNKGCQCLGTVQAASLPAPSAPLRIALATAPADAASVAVLNIPYSIDAPPRTLS